MLKNKLASEEEIMSLFFDGMTLAVGGFGSTGAPRQLIELVIKSGVKDITLISNDAGDRDVAQGRFYTAGIVKHAIHSHVGLNPDFSRMAQEGKFTYELFPQGNLVEKIRCGGIGAGGILLDTGLNTDPMIEEGKTKITLHGKEWLIEEPIRADIALVRARKADYFGNMTYRGVQANYNPVIAMCGDITICEADMICEIEEIPMDEVKTPGVFVDYVLNTQRRYI